MAVTPLNPPKPVPPSEEEKLVKALMRNVDRAKQDRNRHQARIADCYKHAMPWRHKFFQNQPNDDLDENFDETIQTVLEDFAADMLNTFTPQKNNWLTEEPAEHLDEGDKRRIREPLARRQKIVFAEMARSNLYQALQESYLDLGTGTMSLIVNDIGAHEPLHCEAIPITDKLITRGPYGFVDGDYTERKYRRSEAEVLWPDAAWHKLGVEPQDKDSAEVDIVSGCWRDWNDRGNEKHVYCVVSGSHLLVHREYFGAGSSPYITARWSRDPTTAYGVGPTYRSLPAIKTLNHIRYLDLKNYDKHVDPAISYVDDGVVNLDNGVSAGLWIPRAPGSDAPEAIESRAKFDVAVFERDELRSAIRRAHYQDRPEQLGKTPPTATQWADEAAERARRMGTPATNLVIELQYQIYRRFVNRLEKRGTLQPIELDGRFLTLQPVSPLLRAQEQEKVVRRDKYAELLVARFGPQIAAIVIDVVTYAQKQSADLGIEPEITRKASDIENAIKQLMPVLQATGAVPGGDVNVPAVLPGAV